MNNLKGLEHYILTYRLFWIQQGFYGEMEDIDDIKLLSRYMTVQDFCRLKRINKDAADVFLFLIGEAPRPECLEGWGE